MWHQFIGAGTALTPHTDRNIIQYYRMQMSDIREFYVIPECSIRSEPWIGFRKILWKNIISKTMRSSRERL